MKLRDYQLEAFNAALRDFKEVVSTLIVKATGLGKTILFGHLAKHFSQWGRVLVIAHRQELVFQARDKIKAITGETPEVEMGLQSAGGANLYGQESPIIVASVQTLISGMQGKGRMIRFPPESFSLIIIDEAHHATAKSYRKVMAYFKRNPKLRILGVTATPDRSDEEALGQIFDRCSFKYEINHGIEGGWLVPVVQRLVTVEGLDFSAVRTLAGDFNSADLAEVMEYEGNLHPIAHPTFEIAAGRKTIVFAASVAHAERLCEIFNRWQAHCARFVSGKTDDVTRKATLDDFRTGVFHILVNCMVLTEGYDEPTVQVIAIARPTKSRSLYAQMIGRGTRALPGVVDDKADPTERSAAIEASGKRFVEILDFVGNSGKHKLMTTASVLGGNYSEQEIEQAEKIAKETSAEGKPVQMMLALDQARAELLAEKAKKDARDAEERRRRERVLARAQYSTTKIDPFDVLDIKPPSGQHWNKGKPPTEKQIDLLRRFGVDNAGQLTAGGAGKLLTEIFARKSQGKCTFGQAKVLKKYGYSPEMSFGDAKTTIDAIKNNGWKKPTGSQGSVAEPQPYRKRVMSSTPTEGVL